jgi:DNA-binding NtrC family response regulator
MPGWSGLEILAAVREAGLTLPVVLVTAFGSPTTHATAQRLGVSAMLDKPFQVDGLCRVVRDALTTG